MKLSNLVLCLGLISPLSANSQELGSALTGTYRNFFEEEQPTRISELEVDTKLGEYWLSLFEGDDLHRVYFPQQSNANGPTAYILDTGNQDIRSEGMSYGMMIAVQMNRKAEFDALWNWASTHMRYASGPRKGYFRWQCSPDGCQKDTVPASDGEAYFATALFFAAGRWGNGQGIYDYESEANSILNTMLHKEDMNGGVVDGVTNMFNHQYKQVVFVPLGDAATFTDPSYQLPAFYEIWGRRAAGWNGHRSADRSFWLDAAKASRELFTAAADPQTALTPDYSEFDGHPKALSGHENFRFDAFRTAVNWSVDQAWWQADPRATSRTEKLQAFFKSRGLDRYESQFRLDGTPLSNDRSAALIASNGAAAVAISDHSGEGFISRLWQLQPPSGRWRYYDGLLQYMALLHASGRFRAW